jgi:hypothetical protein
MNRTAATLLSVALATVVVVGGGVAVADLVSADDADDISPIEVRKDDAGSDVELVDDDEDEGDRDDTRGDRDDTRSDNTPDGVDTFSDDTSAHAAAPVPAPSQGPALAPPPAYPDDDGFTGDDGAYSDG